MALGLALLAPLPAWAVVIEYGIVTVVDEVDEDYDGDDDALVGGLLGEFMENTADAVDDLTGYGYFEYTVELIDRDDDVIIRTEQDDIDEGDCVSLERGEHSNIRRVSSWHCEDESEDPPEHHARMADECDEAKQQLVDAESDDELDAAIQKVRILCED